jgi:SAM-dependent methyltransferase
MNSLPKEHCPGLGAKTGTAPTARPGRSRCAAGPAALPLAFNGRAATYTSFAVVQQCLAAWLAEWLEPLACSAGLTGLEFGAGPGLFTRFLAGRLRRLTATDTAPNMVELGRRQLPHVEWRVADAWRLDGPCVDRLFSASLLHWCADPVLVLSDWRRLTRRGGRMLHGFYVAPSLAEWQSIDGTYSPVNWRSPSQWEAWMREAGWVVLRSETQTHVQRFASALDLFRFFHRTGAIAPRHTPIANLRRILAEYQRKFAPPIGAPAVTSTWTFFRVEAANC